MLSNNNFNEIRYEQKVLFLDEYVGSGQKFKMMRHALVDQLDFMDMNFGFFFSQGDRNVEGEDILIGSIDMTVSLDLGWIAVELGDGTEMRRGKFNFQEFIQNRDAF